MFRPHRLAAPLSCVLATLALGPASAQQPPDVTATYLKLEPQDTFAFTIEDRQAGKKTSSSRSVGVLRWTVPTSEFGTSGLDRNFVTYCAEPLVGVTAGMTYRFAVQQPTGPETFGFPIEAGKEADRRMAYIRELYGRHYSASLEATDPSASAAFQAALWELLNEASPPENGRFGLFTGTFRADYPNEEEAPEFVRRADGHLAKLTGDDGVFFSNPALKGKELVRLKGVGKGDEEAPQAQLALRYAEAAAGEEAAAAGGSPVAPGGGAPGGGGGGGAGGGGGSPPPAIPPVGGGGGGFFGGGGGAPVTTTSVPQPQPPTITTPPVNQEPPTEVPGTTPVPAPPGILLGLLAVGAVLARRTLARRPASPQ